MSERYAVWPEAPQPANLLQTLDLTADGGLARYRWHALYAVISLVLICIVPSRYRGGFGALWYVGFTLERNYLSKAFPNGDTVRLTVWRKGRKAGTTLGEIFFADGQLRFSGPEISIALAADRLKPAPGPRKILGVALTAENLTKHRIEGSDFTIAFQEVGRWEHSLENEFLAWRSRSGSTDHEMLPPLEDKPSVRGHRRAQALVIVANSLVIIPIEAKIAERSTLWTLGIVAFAILLIAIGFLIPLRRGRRPVSSLS
ncbi:hypothetical protein EON79_12460 [bacterium]|nr:MAG: hypothetical protein EON79_12460 [bacterium]